MIETTIETSVHGRYLMEAARSEPEAGLLIGFHGYGESADEHLARLIAIPDSSEWLIVSVQGLHRFYDRRTNRVVASWMTRQDRELAIVDNVRYVLGVVEAASRFSRAARIPRIVFAGFSQGVAMAFRAAAHVHQRPAHVLAVGGDVPPELLPADLGRIASALVYRGLEDAFYGKDVFSRDVDRLAGAGVDVRAVEGLGGHEWSAALIHAAGEYLARCRR
jgi:predicted esterase